MTDRDSDYLFEGSTSAGISMATGEPVYTEPKTKATGSALYLDELEENVTETKTVAKKENTPMSKKDKNIITVLALLNVAVFVFIGIFLLRDDESDAYKTAKANASFDPAVDYFNTTDIFSELNAYVKGVDFPAGIRDEYKYLYSENTDTVGWLRINGTSIDGVVVRGDTNSEYERTDFYKQADQRTRIFFMDFRNTIGLSSDNLSKVTVIYGHHLTADECIFAEIEDYMDVEYYKTHPTVQFNTLYGDYTWKVFACIVTTVDREDDNGNLFYYWNPYVSDEETTAFAGECLTRSYFVNPAVDIVSTDKLLMLSTCTYILNKNEFINARCVLCARLVRPFESTDVDVSAAYQNENRRMPQVYYSLYGLNNPYASTPVFKAANEQ